MKYTLSLLGSLLLVAGCHNVKHHSSQLDELISEPQEGVVYPPEHKHNVCPLPHKPIHSMNLPNASDCVTFEDGTIECHYVVGGGSTGGSIPPEKPKGLSGLQRIGLIALLVLVMAAIKLSEGKEEQPKKKRNRKKKH